MTKTDHFTCIITWIYSNSCTTGTVVQQVRDMCLIIGDNHLMTGLIEDNHICCMHLCVICSSVKRIHLWPYTNTAQCKYSLSEWLICVVRAVDILQGTSGLTIPTFPRSCLVLSPTCQTMSTLKKLEKTTARVQQNEVTLYLIMTQNQWIAIKN